MVSLTLWPLAPWQAAHTVVALSLPASISAACANGATARTTDNPSIFFMGPLLCTWTQGYTSNPARTMPPSATRQAQSTFPFPIRHATLAAGVQREGGTHDDTPDACTLSGHRNRARHRPGTGRDEAPMGRIQPGRHQAQSLSGLRRQGDRPAACGADDSCARGHDAENAVARGDLGQARLRDVRGRHFRLRRGRAAGGRSGNARGDRELPQGAIDDARAPPGGVRLPSQERYGRPLQDRAYRLLLRRRGRHRIRVDRRAARSERLDTRLVPPPRAG